MLPHAAGNGRFVTTELGGDGGEGRAGCKPLFENKGQDWALLPDLNSIPGQPEPALGCLHF